jgi:glutamate synthase domain-containing protein 3
MRNGLRDRVAVRTDGGLQTGRDVLVAALHGAEEYGFGTAALVALGCDMARQCHLDTCPTGIATQREDLRAKFTGTPEDVVRFFTAIAEDVRRELAAIGARSLGEIIGRGDLLVVDSRFEPTLDLSGLLAAPAWPASPLRRSDPARARLEVAREQAAPTEVALADGYARLAHIVPDERVRSLEHADHPVEERPYEALATITTAERSFGAHISGLIERRIIRRPVRWTLEGSAGQSFGAFANDSVELTLVGQANDYVGKGLSGGTVILRPEAGIAGRAADLAIAGNTCLYGATGGRMHVVGRAGMRFAVRNSGAVAVVEGIGAHGCEYMTGGTAAILGPAGANLCAGMTGGRVYLWDPSGTRIASLDRKSATAMRLGECAGSTRADAAERVAEFRTLLEAHRDAGSELARNLLARKMMLGDEVWLIEPIGAVAAVAPDVVESAPVVSTPASAAPAGSLVPA